MPTQNSTTEYSKLIGKLEGTPFEKEVCARLQTIFVDFQRIPAKPQGDGGLDGLSHGQKRAYCCYGPEQEARKLDNTGLKKDIVDKFSKDLRRLFELNFENRKLKQVSNQTLGNIMAADCKIQHVCLIVSWFESNRLIGPLNTAFNKYKGLSQLKFVDAGATLTVWGEVAPKIRPLNG